MMELEYNNNNNNNNNNNKNSNNKDSPKRAEEESVNTQDRVLEADKGHGNERRKKKRSVANIFRK